MSGTSLMVSSWVGVAAGPTVGAGTMETTIQAGDLSKFHASNFDYSYIADILLVVALAAGYFFVHKYRDTSVVKATRQVQKKEEQLLQDCFEPRKKSYTKTPDETRTPLTTHMTAKPKSGRSSGSTSERHRQLNQQLCKLEHAEEVLAMVAESGMQMNGVNLSTALHRVAKWSKKQRLDVVEVRGAPQWKKLVRLTHQKLGELTAQGVANTLWAVGTMQLPMEEEPKFIADVIAAAEEHVESFTPQALANTAWACATMNWQHSTLLGKVQRSCVASFSSFNPQDLSNIAWAFGTLGFLSQAFLDGTAKVALPMVAACKPGEMANIVWAFARANQRPKELFDRVAEVVTSSADGLNSQALCTIAWSFATVGHKDEEMMASILRAGNLKMRWFSPKELSNLLWACATMNVGSDRFLDAACNSVVRCRDNFAGEEVANVIWALATLKFMHSQCCEHLANTILRRRDEISAKALTNILWGYATLGHKNPALFVNLAEVVQSSVDCLSTTELITIAWSYSVCGVRIPEMLQTLARAASGTLDQQQAEVLSTSFKKLSFVCLPMGGPEAATFCKIPHSV
mmetsp:Transcript_122442/g.280597  ORF Transcript_122442/g.280597 Transcript_122442/m.280597 type:complete len:573 (-) Transcript_122442:214-1932(-)